MEFFPSEIRRLEDSGVMIRWMSGEESVLSSEILRNNCPCATCREGNGDTSHSSPLLSEGRSLLRVIEHSKEDSLKIDRIWGVGNYAIGIAWADGHDSGIFNFELLRKLAIKP